MQPDPLVEFPPELTADYELVRRLGAGAMGVVFLARQRALGRSVAIKVMQTGGHRDHHQRFLREAQGMGRIDHPNVVQIYDSGLAESGSPYLILEYLEGHTLDALPTTPTPEEILAFVPPVAAALEAVHAADLIHRDVKPENLYCTLEGRVLLLDFGLAKPQDRTALTRTGQVVGTPAYMAPEALTGGDPQPSWDWYALGATLFRLAEGRVPHATSDIIECLTDRRPLPPLEFQQLDQATPLAAVIRSLTHPDPRRRPAGVASLQALIADPRHEPTQDTAPGRSTVVAGKVTAPQANRTGMTASTGSTPHPGAKTALPPGVVALWLLLFVALGWFYTDPSPASVVPDPTNATSPTSIPSLKLLALGSNAAGYQEFQEPKSGEVMILVPAGEFTSYASDDPNKQGTPQTHTLDAFLIGKYEVSVQHFWDYARVTGSSPRKGIRYVPHSPGQRLPMIKLTLGEVEQFCEWAGGRLPRGLEWERAAAGTDGRVYPWGATPPDATRANFGNADIRAAFKPQNFLKPTDSYPQGASPIGALNMAGNAIEWTSDIHTPTAEAEHPDRVIRGGNFYVAGDQLATWFRRGWSAKPGEPQDVGFRLTMDVPPDLLEPSSTTGRLR